MRGWFVFTPSGPMHYVSLIIESLRGRPRTVFWTVALTQAALWTLMPAIFYSAPPGDVPLLLAIGQLDGEAVANDIPHLRRPLGVVSLAARLGEPDRVGNFVGQADASVQRR